MKGVHVYIYALYIYIHTQARTHVCVCTYIYTRGRELWKCVWGGLFFGGGSGFRREGEGKGRDILQTCPTNELVSWLHLMTLTGHRRAVGNNVMRVPRPGGGGRRWGGTGVRVSAGRGGSGAERREGARCHPSPPSAAPALCSHRLKDGEKCGLRGGNAQRRGVRKRVFRSEAARGGGCRDIPVECAVGPRVRRPLPARSREFVFSVAPALCVIVCERYLKYNHLPISAILGKVCTHIHIQKKKKSKLVAIFFFFLRDEKKKSFARVLSSCLCAVRAPRSLRQTCEAAGERPLPASGCVRRRGPAPVTAAGSAGRPRGAAGGWPQGAGGVCERTYTWVRILPTTGAGSGVGGGRQGQGIGRGFSVKLRALAWSAAGVGERPPAHTPVSPSPSPQPVHITTGYRHTCSR